MLHELGSTDNFLLLSRYGFKDGFWLLSNFPQKYMFVRLQALEDQLLSAERNDVSSASDLYSQLGRKYARYG